MHRPIHSFDRCMPLRRHSSASFVGTPLCGPTKAEIIRGLKSGTMAGISLGPVNRPVMNWIMVGSKAVLRPRKADHPLHAIYAVSYKKTPAAFPMVWAPSNKTVSAVNVTDRYANKQTTDLPEGHVEVQLRVVDGKLSNRISAPITLVQQHRVQCRVQRKNKRRTLRRQ